MDTSQVLWKLFEKICEIPHPSGHEDAIRDFLIGLAQDAELTCHVDTAGNLLIEKPASKNYKNAKTIILQNHLDMVPQIAPGVDFDFTKDSIITQKDGDWLTACGTTLGADNGIGVAATMALLLDKNIEHGPMRALFTVEEETGMGGAYGLGREFLEGDVLLNLDSEDEGEIFIGCAGGNTLKATFDISFETLSSADTYESYRIELDNLPGGHSGCDIHHQQLGNAIKLMTELVQGLPKKLSPKIISFGGGTLNNAIPRDAYVDLFIEGNKSNLLESFIDGFVAKNSANFEPSITLIPLNTSSKQYWIEEFAKNFFEFLATCPHGVIAWSSDFSDVVETSTNLAVVKHCQDKIVVTTSQRSLANEKRQTLAKSIQLLVTQYNGTTKISSTYPGWQPKKGSKLTKLVCNTYYDLFKTQPVQKVIHAGLECGLIGSINPNLEMVSFGPDIKNPHSPNEKVKISSVNKFHTLLTEIVKKIK